MSCKKLKIFFKYLANYCFSKFTFYNDTSKQQSSKYTNMFIIKMLNLGIEITQF